MMHVLAAIADYEFGYLVADFISNHKWTKGTRIKLLHVIPMDPKGSVPGPYYPDLTPERLEKAHDQAQKLLNDIRQRIERHMEPGLAVIETEVHNGPPADEIMEVSQTWPADVVVMGSHGRSGISRFMLGSVSHSVLTHVHCSTFIVKKSQRTH